MNALRHFIRDGITRVDLLLVTVLSVLATVPFGRLLVNYHFVVTVTEAAVLALVVTTALARKPLVLSVLVGTVGFGVFLMLVVFKSGPSQSWTGITSTWSDLLTSTTPAVASPSVIAAPVLLGWAATMVGCLVALRTKVSPGPIVAPLVVLVVALAFAGKQPAGSVLYPVAVVIVVLGILLSRAQASGRRRGRGTRRMASAAIVFAGATLIAVAFGTVAPAGSAQSRFDLRAHYNPPLDLSDQVTPLAEVTPSGQDTSTTPIFTVKFTGIPAGTKISLLPIAYLESYDGAVWGTSAPFSLAGPDLPPGPAVDVPTVAIRQTYQLTKYPSAFLPALEGAHTISGAPLGYDRTTGTLVDPAGSDASLAYSVVSDVPQVTTAEIEHAHPGIAPSVATLALPPAPPNESWTPELRQFEAQYGTGSTQLAKLESLLKELQSTKGFGYNTQTRPGHSLGVLSDFLDGKADDPNSRIGDSEQFAAAFAVLARMEGFPSRVVVGYRLPKVVEAGGTQTVSVVPSDMYAWTEVNFNGVGWVTFDPTNPTPRRAPLGVDSTTPVVTPTSLAGSANTGGGGGSPPKKTKSHNAGTLKLFIILAVIVALPALIVAAKKLRKRARRERGTPTEQILGAWKEARDRMRDRNVRMPRSVTALEMATRCNNADRPELGDRISALGPLVDRALYAPEPPEDSDVDAAWEAEAGVEDALKSGTDPAARLRGAIAAVDPRSLVGSIGRR
jgi:hypothetical protein